MFRILVPVDFYKTSFSAYHYAAHFSQQFENVELVLLHVINGSFNTNDIIVFHPMQQRETVAMDRLDYFQNGYAKSIGVKLPKVRVTKEVRFGIPGWTITNYANNNDVDIIIMGTRDKHSLFDRMIGSASAISVRKANCPVMLIHENARYNKPDRLVFAFDERTDIEDAVEDFLSINRVLKAATDFIHVDDSGNNNIKNQITEIIDELFEGADPSFAIQVKRIKGEKMQEAIKDYCLFSKADILCMVHREEGFFTNLFRTQNSVQVAQEFHLPVLVFKEDT